MRFALTRSLCVFFTAYIFAISSGFSVSHVYCEHGDRWVLGAEMPPKKHNKHQDNRKKETFHFFMKIDAENKTLSPSIDFQTPIKHTAKASKPYAHTAKNPVLETPRSNAPPELLTPSRSQLQIYII